jgi:hypothetical protein
VDGKGTEKRREIDKEYKTERERREKEKERKIK